MSWESDERDRAQDQLDAARTRIAELETQLTDSRVDVVRTQLARTTARADALGEAAEEAERLYRRGKGSDIAGAIRALIGTPAAPRFTLGEVEEAYSTVISSDEHLRSMFIAALTGAK